ncbi:MAG: VCBS repeat-containing protein [Candidatus Hydrogenedentes bacterium]|nr:VCBS repeat-containing protein [Candidatus Hydrogenedentota bacterium]
MPGKTFVLTLILAAGAGSVSAFPTFRVVDVNPDAGTGLAITVADVNRDGRPDIIGVSSDDVAWYENPTWERHLMAPTLRNSNVCIAGQDLDGDGIPEFALGADWQFNNTAGGGALYLLEHAEDPKALWKVRTLVEECPTLHRIRWFQHAGKPALAVAPLKGIGTTPPAHQEKGVELFALTPPPRYFDEAWQRTLIDSSLHVLHNIWPGAGTPGNDALLAASFEGVSRFDFDGGAWRKTHLVAGNPAPLPDSGSGEIKSGNWPGATGVQQVLSTIEPWHGTQAVVYYPDPAKAEGFVRLVVDDAYKGGHAVYWADFDGDGADELLAGYRENAGPKNLPGLYCYDFNLAGGKVDVSKHVVDDGGMATEDAVAADMNGDGRPDVVAYGRATHNIRYYENQGE